MSAPHSRSRRQLIIIDALPDLELFVSVGKTKAPLPCTRYSNNRFLSFQQHLVKEKADKQKILYDMSKISSTFTRQLTSLATKINRPVPQRALHIPSLKPSPASSSLKASNWRSSILTSQFGQKRALHSSLRTSCYGSLLSHRVVMRADSWI